MNLTGVSKKICITPLSEEEKGFSTSIEVTLSPRRTNFVDSKTEMEMDHIGLGLNGLGGRQPVSYGYL